MRGPITQSFMMAGEAQHVSLDLVRHCVRWNNKSWACQDYAPSQIFDDIQTWLGEHSVVAKLERPELKAQPQHYDTVQASNYATALWWVERQFDAVKSSLTEGVTSPIFLYPHHFDLSLVWFPLDDEKQLAIGFSTGDETITEPYLYFTAYPEPKTFTELKLPTTTHWQQTGFVSRGGITLCALAG